jgi:hypothetical protein
MAKERQNFIAGCARTNNIPEKKANSIFDLLEKFAGYGFNKSHSAPADLEGTDLSSKTRIGLLMFSVV